MTAVTTPHTDTSTVTAGFPPGPRLPWPVQTALFARRRSWWLHRVARRYGQTFTLRVPPYARRLVVVSHPDQIKQVFAASPAELRGGEGNHIIGGLMGPHSVLVLDDDAHARIRRLVMPAFSGPALRRYRETIAAVAAAAADSWADGSEIVALDEMNAVTLDLIVRVVFGVTDSERRAALIPRLETMARIHPVVLAGLEQPRLQSLGPWKRFRRNESEVNEILFDEIRTRRTDPNLPDRADVLSRMLAVGADPETGDTALTDDEVRDQLISLLLAGHETTASALAWAMYELARHPHIQDQARAAAFDGDDKYIDAVFREAMRRHTIVSGTYRRLGVDMTFDRWTVPAGAFVSTSALLSHSDPDNFPDGTVFDPDRFLTGHVAPHAWIPFGGGPRRCLGSMLALLEGTVVLREILVHHRLSLPSGAPYERHQLRNVTHVPARGARLTVTAIDRSAR